MDQKTNHINPTEDRFFPEIHIPTLERLAAGWQEEFTVIRTITLARGRSNQSFEYGLIIEVDTDANHEDLELFRSWQAGGESCTHIRWELADAVLPKAQDKHPGWCWFVQAVGSGLPKEFVIEESAAVLCGDGEPEIEGASAAIEPAASKPQGNPAIEINEVGDGIFQVTFKGEQVTVKHKGLRIAQFAIARPCVAIPYNQVNTFYGRHYAPPTATSREAGAMTELLNSESAHFGESAIERTDLRSINEVYREKLELENERDSATQECNMPLAGECERKIEELQKYLNDNSFCGRPRLESIYRTTRARLAKAHQRALQALGKEYAEARDYLQPTIKFEPDGVWYRPGVKDTDCPRTTEVVCPM